MADGEKKPYYRLVYFNGNGRAEPIRMMFRIAGVEFVDERMTDFEEWMTKRSTECPLRQVPVLETENGVIAQTPAIINYVADRLGFLPEDKWQRAISDSIVTTLNDLATTVAEETYIYTIYKFQEIDEEQLQKNMNGCREAIALYLNYVESLSVKGAKFIFGDRMLAADYLLYQTLEYCALGYPETREHSEWIKTFLSNASNDPDLSAHLKNRPASAYGT